MLIPACKGIETTDQGLDLNAENAVREFARVFILTPNRATP